LRASGVTVAVTALALGGAACTSFQDRSTVLDLRVLGIEAEPPEIILDMNDPGSDLPIDVTPLIADPKGDGRSVTFSLVACPNRSFGTAPPAGGNGMGGFGSGGARDTVSSNTCPDGDALTWPLMSGVPNGSKVTVHITPEQLIAAFMNDIYVDQKGNFHGGFDLGEPITLDLRAQAGSDTAEAIKRVLFWGARISPDQMVNQIPTIAGVTTYPDRDPDTFSPVETPVTLAENAPQAVVAGGSLWVEPTSPPNTAESYVTTVVDPATDQAVPLVVDRETLRYGFYATAGTFSPSQTSSELIPGFVNVDVTGKVHIESQWSAPANVEDVPIDLTTGKRLVTVWIVVRDDRAGESWTIRQLELTAPP
jgi:hypothetical protein